MYAVALLTAGHADTQPVTNIVCCCPPAVMFAVPDRWPASLTFKLTAGVTMLQLFGAGNSLMAAQLLGNATLMQVTYSQTGC